MATPIKQVAQELFTALQEKGITTYADLDATVAAIKVARCKSDVEAAYGEGTDVWGTTTAKALKFHGIAPLAEAKPTHVAISEDGVMTTSVEPEGSPAIIPAKGIGKKKPAAKLETPADFED